MSKRGQEPTERLRVSLKAGRHVRLRAELRATPAGLASIAGLVSTMLLSGMVLTATVVAARRQPGAAILPPLRR